MYEDKAIDLVVLWLVQELKKATSGIDNMSDPRDTLLDSLAVFFKMKQGATEANDQFLDRFKANVSTVELAGGSDFLCPTNIMDKQLVIPTKSEIKTEVDRFAAMHLLKSSDDKRYGDMKSRLKESAALGRNEYPRSVSYMYELMVNQCPDSCEQ